MAGYDVIIIGLGTVGSATCMTLAQRGYKVLGIDQFHPPHNRGSHHGLSRSVRRAYLEGTSYVAMAFRAWDLWRKLEKDAGRKLLVSTGNLTIGPPEGPAVSGFAASARLYDIPHECLSAAEINKRWPQLTPPDQFVGGLEHEAGIVFPEQSISAFLAEAGKAGAELILGKRVNQWSEGKGSVVVHTADKRYEAARLFLAAGAWTAKLLDLPTTSLSPRRVPVHWFEAPEGSRYHLGNFPVNFWQVPVQQGLTASQHYQAFYTLPIVAQGTGVKAAFHNGLDDCDPDTVDREVKPSEAEMMREVIARFIPGLYHRAMTSEVCLYSMTPDGHFYLGQTHRSDKVFASAFAGHGFKFAPVLGEIMADLIVDQPPEFDIELFSPRRFQSR